MVTGHAKERAIARMLRANAALTAEKIARAIEASVCAPGEHCAGHFCPDCIRYAQSREDAATARRAGGAA